MFPRAITPLQNRKKQGVSNPFGEFMPQKILAILKKGAYIARKWRWTCFEFVRHVFFAPSMVLKQVKNFRREGYEVWMDDLFLEAFAV